MLETFIIKVYLVCKLG